MATVLVPKNAQLPVTPVPATTLKPPWYRAVTRKPRERGYLPRYDLG